MVTCKSTEIQQTNTETYSLTIKTNSSEYDTIIQNSRGKKSENIVTRKSKTANMSENLDMETKSLMNKEPYNIKTQVSTPELDADSAIGSETNGVASFENDELLNDLDKLVLQDNDNSVNQFHNSFKSQRRTLSTTPPNQTGCGIIQKAKFKHNRIKPESFVLERNAFQQDSECPVSNTHGTIDLPCDGSEINCSLTPELSPGTEVSSLTTCSRGHMLDFVILHSDADLEDVCAFMTHLLQDIGIDDLTVDLLSSIDAGQTRMQSLTTLHDNYRYILTFVTPNLTSDRYNRFLQEILVTLGLQEANGKEDRVVPVFTKKEPCNIPEISILNGLQYFKFHSTNWFIRKSYLDSVKRLIEAGRAKFP